MPYVKVGPWVNGAAPPISAANLDQVETQYDQVLADKFPHGNADHTDRTRELFIPVNAHYFSAGTPGNEGRYSVIIGLANNNQPVGVFSFKVPIDFVAFLSVKAVWTCFGAAAGNMYWLLAADYAAAGEAYDTHQETPAAGAFGVTATGGAKVINVQEPANALTLANLALGDYVGILFNRLGADALDTLNNDMSLLGILFSYTADQ